MSHILIDSSVWISFFKGNKETLPMLDLIDSNRVCTNDLILSELIPFLVHRKENHLVEILQIIENIELNINWSLIIEMQSINLKNGINKVGVPDLIIAQNAIQKNIPLYSLDKHFQLMKGIHQLKMFPLQSV